MTNNDSNKEKALQEIFNFLEEKRAKIRESISTGVYEKETKASLLNSHVNTILFLGSFIARNLTNISQEEKDRVVTILEDYAPHLIGELLLREHRIQGNTLH